MEFNQIELRRETIFKDAVLSAAEAKGMDILTQAQHDSARQLAEARAQCKKADHDTVAAALAHSTEREQSAAAAAARRELLFHRADLVDRLFAEVEKRLADFTQSKDYPAWLGARAARHKGMAKKGVALTALLSPQDAARKDAVAAVQKALPGCTVAPDSTLRLGGVKISDGQTLQDESFGSALEAEKENFYRTSGLSL